MKRWNQLASQARHESGAQSKIFASQIVVSTDEPSESSAYIKLNIPMPCPPRGTVPVNSRAMFGDFFNSQRPIRFRSGMRLFQLCAFDAGKPGLFRQLIRNIFG
jgi:hypothetical protein